MKKLTTLLITFCFSTYTYCQIDSLLNVFIDDLDTNGYIYPKENTLEQGQFAQLFTQFFLDGGGSDYYSVCTDTFINDSISGKSIFYYDIYFLDFRVQGAGIKEHVNSENYVVFGSGYTSRFNYVAEEFEAMISESFAYELAYNNLKAIDDSIVFAFEDNTYEQGIKNFTGDSSISFYPIGELVMALKKHENVEKYLIPDTNYIPTWMFSFITARPTGGKFNVYINIFDSSIVKVDTLLTSGTATVKYYGNKYIDVKKFGSKYILQTNEGLRRIHTKRSSTWSSFYVLPNITDSDGNWGTSDQNATSSHYAIGMSEYYFKSRFAVQSSLMHKGIHVLSGTNYNPGFNYATRESKGYFEIYTGEDNETHDLIGHEYAHSLINKVGKIENQDESGVVLEGLSDFFGGMIEAYCESGLSDWTINEDHSVIRSMSSPNSYGTPAKVGDLFYLTSNFNNNYYTHTNSTVLSYALYLSSVGALFNGIPVNGIGHEKVAKICYYSLHITPTKPTLKGFANASVEASKLLYGSCSSEHKSIERAMAAVNIRDFTECQPSNNKEFNNKFSPNVIVYPNPTAEINQNISIISNFDFNEIIVQDIKGCTISLEKFQLTRFKNLNISSFKKGVYFILVKSENNFSKVEKFIVN